MNNKYRLEALQREADDVAKYLKGTVGLLNCELEIVGALLFVKYRGEEEKISKLLEKTHTKLKEVDKFLEELKDEKRYK